jgi:hypothetical protein
MKARSPKINAVREVENYKARLGIMPEMTSLKDISQKAKKSALARRRDIAHSMREETYPNTCYSLTSGHSRPQAFFEGMHRKRE